MSHQTYTIIKICLALFIVVAEDTFYVLAGVYTKSFVLRFVTLLL